MTEARTRSGRLQLVLIAAVFIGPLLLAMLLYFRGEAAQPVARTNHGALLEPITSLREAVPGSPLHGHGGLWLLIYDEPAQCAAECRRGLYTIRQSRLMLGKDMQRLGRILLHGESVPDTVFLDEEHQGLIAIQDSALSLLLANKKPNELSAGGYYLVDPLGNLVMYFHPEIDPRDMVDDIKRLLKLSRIG